MEIIDKVGFRECPLYYDKTWLRKKLDEKQSQCAGEPHIPGYQVWKYLI